MPFDGIVTKSITLELRSLIGGRVEKIYQTEPDEIIMSIRCANTSNRILMSANASLPRIHPIAAAPENPQYPPAFCMVLRKHLLGGRINDVVFHDYERMITVMIQSLNDLGDPVNKKLVIEIMGRYSNIILVNDANIIIDAIKHVGAAMSSVRQILPGKAYTVPPPQNKINPEDISGLVFNNNSGKNIEKYLLDNVLGLSPLLCREICHHADVDPSTPTSALTAADKKRLSKAVGHFAHDIINNNFKPCVIFDGKTPVDFHCMDIRQYGPDRTVVYFTTIGRALDEYYAGKTIANKLEQKRSGMLRSIGAHLDRCNKKRAIQEETLDKASDGAKYKLYGELLTANIYSIPPGVSHIELIDYTNQRTVDIPLDERLSVNQNAQRYFRLYKKANATAISTRAILEQTAAECGYLESVCHAIESAASIQEISEIHEELAEQGYIKSGADKNRTAAKSREDAKAVRPHEYTSSDGYTIFAGKNNRQNDKLTMKQAANADIWLHARNIPGSHVILKVKNSGAIPETALKEAAMIAAYHSKARISSNVPVDYTNVKNIKKPPGSKPGMVFYENFRTIIVTPDESIVLKLRNL